MTNKQLKNLKDTLWTTADQLRANSGLKSTEYAEPILGLIFLRFADVKYSKFEPEMENLQNQKSNEELVAIPEKYMLTIREAASYFNIGIKNMRRLCESNEGEFSVRWGNKYLICRPKLEAYLNQLMVRERNKNDVGLEENHGVS